MDKRLELTEKQKELVKGLSDTFEEMKKENVGIMLCDVSDHHVLAFVNKSDVLYFDRCDYYEHEGDENDWHIWKDNVIIEPNPDDLSTVELPYELYLDVYGEENDDFFSVALTPSTPEEVEALKQSRERELVDLPHDISFFQKEIDEMKKGEMTDTVKNLIPRYEKMKAEKEARLAELKSITEKHKSNNHENNR